MKGIYLAAFVASHPKYNIVYQDINGQRDIDGDMMDVNLSKFDFVIATPPCNFWSKARGKRLSSYSLKTYHLLPSIILKLIDLGKPFIVENVVNRKLMDSFNLFDLNCYIFEIGRHTYWTNVLMDVSDIKTRQDFTYGGYVIKYDDMDNLSHQGGFNVFNVIERFLKTIHKRNYYGKCK